MANRIDVEIHLNLSDKEVGLLKYMNQPIFNNMTMIEFLKEVVDSAPKEKWSMPLIMAAITTRLEIIRAKGGKAYVETKQK